MGKQMTEEGKEEEEEGFKKENPNGYESLIKKGGRRRVIISKLDSRSQKAWIKTSIPF